MLECHVTGVPPPSVSWQRNGDVIDAASADYALSQISGTCCLKIKRAGSQHAGQYTCSATNAAGKATTSASVNVICEPVFCRSPCIICQGRSRVENCGMDTERRALESGSGPFLFLFEV